MADQKVLTVEGEKKLQEELQDLRVVKRKEIADKISEAREQGDLSENAEYDAAKDEQRHIEARIEEIEAILKNAVIVAESGDKDTINIGSTVKILDIDENTESVYSIVGSTESDILNNKISNESAVGSALLGAKAGDTVNVQTPSGDIIQYKVLEIISE